MIWALVLFAFGAFMFIRCGIAGLKEYRSGKAVGRFYAVHDRRESPIMFWIVLFFTFLASLFGLVLVVAMTFRLIRSLL